MFTPQQIYLFCPHCKTKLTANARHKTCPTCQRLYYFNPKPCVGVVVTNAAKEVLLVKRAYQPFKGYWDLPGGFVEEHETTEEAARRELKEETNLAVATLSYLGSVTEIYPFHNDLIPVVVVYYAASVTDHSGILAADDVNDYQFVRKDKIDFTTIAFENQRTFLQNLVRQR